jgi:hypothetical protein
MAHAIAYRLLSKPIKQEDYNEIYKIIKRNKIKNIQIN